LPNNAQCFRASVSQSAEQSLKKEIIKISYKKSNWQTASTQSTDFHDLHFNFICGGKLLSELIALPTQIDGHTRKLSMKFASDRKAKDLKFCKCPLDQHQWLGNIRYTYMLQGTYNNNLQMITTGKLVAIIHSPRQHYT